MTFRLTDVSYAYDSSATQQALSELSCSIPSGAFIAVLGLSGSGKTTLLNLLGLLSNAVKHNGTIQYDSTSDSTFVFKELGLETLAKLRRDEFGFVLQSAFMLPHFTCGQNIGMPLALQGMTAEEIDHRVTDLLTKADPSGKMLSLKDRLSRDVSGGEKQRMAVLRAIVHNPHVLFADEPLSNLDPRNADLILDLIRRWRSGELHGESNVARTLILVTHDVEIAWREAEHFLILRSSKLVGDKLHARSELSGVQEIKQLMTGENKMQSVSPSKSTLAKPGFKTFGGFLGWFASRNLWEKSAWRSTWINLISLAVVVAFILLTFGLTKGFQQARIDSLKNDPLNLCFWIGSSNREVPLSRKNIDALDKAIRSRVGDTNFAGVFPCYETKYRWLGKAKEPGKEINISAIGRTVSDKDPMLRSIRLRKSSMEVLNPEKEGIIVSKEMLRDLEFDADEVPEKLKYEAPGGGTIEISVIDVAEKLPLNHQFLVSERQDGRMRSRNPNKPVSDVRMGPIPEGWPIAKELSSTVRGMARTFNMFEILDEKREDGRYWLLTHDGTGEVPTISNWGIKVRRLATQLEKETNVEPGVENMLVAPPVAEEAYLPPELYDYAGFYCLSLDALRPTNEICKTFQLSGNDEIIGQLESIGRQTSAVMAILGLIGAAIAFVVLLNMVMVQVLRSEQRVAEFGMLKAMGMRASDMGRLAMIEARQLWIIGTLMGIAFVLIVGPLTAWGLQLGGVEAQFRWPWLAFAVASIGSLIICVWSNYWATRKSRIVSASESLRAG